MASKDRRIDAYIARAAPFARPILAHLRALVHEACPKVEESIKWSMPFFLHHGMLCNMAAFKEHCAFGFWKGARVFDGRTEGQEQAMGQFGRIRSLADLPSDRTLSRLIRKAAALNEAGVKPAAKAKRAQPRPPPTVPAELAAALHGNARAWATFEGFSPSHRREYCEWIAEARREETRRRRVAQAIEWLAEGKPRNWKYGR